MVLALDEELEMNVYEEEIEVCEFPQCMEYVQVYRIFCDVFDLGKSGRNFKYSRKELLLKFEIKKMVITFHTSMLIIKEKIFQFH